MDSVIADDFVSDKNLVKKKNISSRSIRVALKSKENLNDKTFKRSMNKKLKKYKLRKDGKDDPDVLDISQCLSSTLTIISPIASNNDSENYKMKNQINSSPSQIKLKEYNDRVDLTSKKQQNESTSSFSNYTSREKSPKDVSRKIFSGKIKTKKKKEEVPIETLGNSQNSPDNKQINAFQVMMTARHKSIGGNSPGKEKDCQEKPENELERKNIRVKRTLALQKMVDSKGGVEKCKLEANEDAYIKQQLDERAVRLKEMLTKNNNKNRQNEKNIDKSVKKELKSGLKNILLSETRSPSRHSKVIKEENQTSLNLVKKKTSKSPQEDKTPSVDKDFFNNLSPSIKKKESLLSYFEKTEKKVPILHDDESDNCETELALIKVKFTSRRKKTKIKMKSILLNEVKESKEIVTGESTIFEKTCNIHDIKEDVKVVSIEKKDQEKQLQNENITISPRSSGRLRRNIKRPIKYLSDSEDDVTEDFIENEMMHIFTPKKRRKAKVDTQTEPHCNKIVTPIKILNLNSSKEIVCVRSPKTRNPSMNKDIRNDKKVKNKESTKFAPIFIPKPALEKSVIEARQKFLQSGVPEKLKKIIDKQKQLECISEDYFPIVTHVQQLSLHGDKVFENSTGIRLGKHLDDKDVGLDDLWKRNIHMKQFLDSCSYSADSGIHCAIKKTDVKHHKKYLKEIKEAYPEFPVYRTYNFFKQKHIVENKVVKSTAQNTDDNVDSSFEVLSEIVDIKGDSPEHFMWTDKYKANSATEIIGNFKSINILKKWLLNWKEYNEEQGNFIKNNQNRIRRDSDSWLDDSDSHDSSRPLNNVTVVTGPQGCGKTSSVYAVATELSIKVLEVNASAKRTGKKLLSDLQEATQSHKVNRNKGLSIENSQNSQDSDVWEKTHKRKQKQRKTYSKTEKKTDLSQRSEDPIMSDSQKQESAHVMSLILIEDADLVFEQDDGFISALTQIVQSSKRPIIIITGNVHCAHLQRFIQGNNVLKFKPLSSKMLGTWLDLLILVEKDKSHPMLGSYLLELCNGDIRKAIHSLQFWIGSSGYRDMDRSTLNSVRLEEDISSSENVLVNDESSCSSWSDEETISLKNTVHSDLVMFDVIKTFTSFCYEKDIESKKVYKLEYPTKLTNIWWNISSIWNLDNPKVNSTSKIEKKSQQCIGHQRNDKTFSDCKKLGEMSLFLDVLSVVDCLQGASGIGQVSSDLCLKPWLISPASSVSDSEDLSMYNSHKSFETDWTYSVLSSSLKQIRKNIDGINEFYNIDFSASTAKKTRERDIINNSHNTLYEAIPSSNQLERRGLTTDYLPVLRNVARIEKERADNNYKRNNRFCHYMRSLRIPCDARVLDSLCSSLNTEQLES